MTHTPITPSAVAVEYVRTDESRSRCAIRSDQSVASLARLIDALTESPDVTHVRTVDEHGRTVRTYKD